MDQTVPVEQQEPNANAKTETEEEEIDYGPPRGTIAFVALMLIGYILYYAWHYFEIFILRGV